MLRKYAILLMTFSYRMSDHILIGREKASDFSISLPTLAVCRVKYLLLVLLRKLTDNCYYILTYYAFPRSYRLLNVRILKELINNY